jgi:hypothetical protein
MNKRVGVMSIILWFAISSFCFAQENPSLVTQRDSLIAAAREIIAAKTGARRSVSKGHTVRVVSSAAVLL